MNCMNWPGLLMFVLVLPATACATGDAQAGEGGPGEASSPLSARHGGAQLHVSKIEEIIGASGNVEDGVLDIEIPRTDIGDVSGPRGVTFNDAFEIHGDLYFQPLGGGRALLNGDMALLPEETDAFIAALLEHGLVFQAFHQHLTEMQPQVWFIHFRGVDQQLALAKAARDVLDVTAVSLGQQGGSDIPTTPLDADRLASILHGSANVGDQGVVSVTVPRTDSIVLGAVELRPEAGVSTTIEFKPTGADADEAAVVPDFSMTSEEVNPVVKTMLTEYDWFQGCLYNQEIDEHPQLYFDHMLKTGNAYELAAEIRKGLDLTASR